MYMLKEVIIEITRTCNLGCLHCGSNCQSTSTKQELTASEWVGVILELKKIGIEKIVFSGGEPTLKIDFDKILCSTSKIGIKTGFITNGLIPFGETFQNSIGDCKLFAVGLSIDGLKDTHNYIRGNESSWLGLMKNIAILQNLKKQICAITTLNKMNYRELPKLARLLSLAEVDSWQLQLAMPTGRMKAQSELLITENDFKEICKTVILLRKEYPNLNIQSADCFGLAPTDTIRTGEWPGCLAGISAMAIDATGNTMPCLSLQGGQLCENVRDKSVSEIWSTSEALNLNRSFDIDKVVGKCKNCVYLKDCRGGCNSQSLSYHGNFHNSPFCYTRSFSN